MLVLGLLWMPTLAWGEDVLAAPGAETPEVVAPLSAMPSSHSVLDPVAPSAAAPMELKQDYSLVPHLVLGTVVGGVGLFVG
ncbi:hypothetical protein D7V88_29700, partial [Corallococcus terminator]